MPLSRIYRKKRNQVEDPKQLPCRVTPGRLANDVTELTLDVQHGPVCRGCEGNPPPEGFTYIRLESLSSPIFRPEDTADVGAAFQRACGAINFGLPLPMRTKTKVRWSTRDPVVFAVGLSAPDLEKRPPGDGRRTRRCDAAVNAIGGGQSREAGARGHSGIPQTVPGCSDDMSSDKAERPYVERSRCVVLVGNVADSFSRALWYWDWMVSPYIDSEPGARVLYPTSTDSLLSICTDRYI